MSNVIQMKRAFKRVKIILYLICLSVCVACNQSGKHRFVLRPLSGNVVIYVDKNSDELIHWAANDFAGNLEQLLGKKVAVKYVQQYDSAQPGIYIGKIDDDLMKSTPPSCTAPLQNKWEHFSIQQQNGNLIITGSDIRGTVYGVFDVAERMGISPWLWWADVTPVKQSQVELKLPAQGIVEGPSVQYRGIFLNDEDWGLQPWAANTFEPETGDIGPKTYEKIFQLLLHLKANTIWPAMHPSTKAFYTIPGNREMAEKYHIVIGTSHAEPMLRNNVYEWNEKEYGDFNYFNNRKKVKEYWHNRITEVKNGEQIFTTGIRGIHDSGMKGGSSVEEKTKMLQTVIDDQRQMLSTTFNKPASEIPQVFIPYKEVLDLYDEGLQLYDDITLMWTDDNYGYIRRLSNRQEQQRTGGSGVYYHLSYWGRPHDYLWLSTTQPGLIWYEMSRAYQNGAAKIWIANVGDLKPAEYNIEFFLDLAWDVNSISETSIEKHMQNWCSREFGSKNEKTVAAILNEYYRLAFIRKPEFMGWSRTEPNTPTAKTEFITTPANNELQRRLNNYDRLIRETEAVKANIPKERLDAYFQLVQYPVKCAALMNRKFLFAQKAFLAIDQHNKEKWSQESQKAYTEIVQLTNQYNHEIGNGKWNSIMAMNPRNLAAYQMPDYYLKTSDDSLKTQEEITEFPAPVFIQASEFVLAINREHYYWQTVEGLGYSNSAVTLFPFTQHAFSNDLPSLEYKFSLKKPGEYIIEIRCLPTHSNNFNFTVSAEVNGSSLKTYPINTKGRSEAWKTNVLRNAVVVKHMFKANRAGKQTLKIYVNETGIVLDQIAISPKGAPAFYEIPAN